jgi:hypothetical protein
VLDGACKTIRGYQISLTTDAWIKVGNWKITGNYPIEEGISGSEVF